MLLVASLVGTTACSLLVSTSGLTGGADDAGAAPPDAAAESSAEGAAPPAPPPSPSKDAGADVDPDLLADWTFDDGAGTVAKDATGHGYDAVLAGDATFRATGHAGGSVAMNGSGYVRAMGVEGMVFPQTGTLSIWFRWDTQNTTGDLNVVDNWDNTRPHVFMRHVQGTTATEFQMFLQGTRAAGDYAFGSGLTVLSAKWTHLVITWSEPLKSGAAYQDGALLSSGPYAYAFAPTAEYFRLGEKLIGALDEVRIYTRALAPNEVAALP